MVTTFDVSAMAEYQAVAIGRQGENNYRTFVFDCSGFGVTVESVTLVHARRCDPAAVLVGTQQGDTFTWVITADDTLYDGFGSAQLYITFTDGLVKSVIFRTYTARSITGQMVMPSNLQSWYDAMIDYINSVVSYDSIEQAVQDYLDQHPITAPVTSVNNKIGDVVLTAADVGALASNTAFVASFNGQTGAVTYTAPVSSVNGQTGAVTLSIPTKTSDLQNDSGYITSAPVASVDGKTGTVSVLPTGGTTGQVLAKKTGTNYDVEWQTVSGGGAVDSVNGQTGTVVLGAADVGALASNTPYVSSFNGNSGAVTYVAPVTSVNAKTGAITVNEIFWCTWGTTTSAEIESAIGAGKLPCVQYNNYTYTLRNRNSATNHRFVCNYGGKEYTVVCQSGTWMADGTLTFLTTNYTAPVTSVNGNTGAVTTPNTTYAISIANNVITLTGSDSSTSTVTLPVYNGGVS